MTKIDKPLVKLTKVKKYINNIRNEKVNITRDTVHIKKIIGYMKNLIASMFENKYEIYTSLEKCNLPKSYSWRNKNPELFFNY